MDMDLIEVLWKQDVDLGFTVDSVVPKPEKEDIKLEPNDATTSIGSNVDELEKLKTLQSDNEDVIKEREEDPWAGFDYIIDTETGEYVIKGEADNELNPTEETDTVDLTLDDLVLPLPEFFLDEALRLIDLEDETSQENSVNLKELESLSNDTNSTSVPVLSPKVAADNKAADKTDDLTSSSEEILSKDPEDEFDILSDMIQTPQFHHPHHRAAFQNGSSEINQTDGFLSSILNDEDLQLMDMAMNEGMYTMRMLDGNGTVNNVGTNNTTATSMSRNDMERMDTSSDSAVSSMGSERVPSLSDGEWGDAGSDSGHTCTEHYVTDYTSKLRPYDYSYTSRHLNNSIGSSDNSRIPPVAQKKHQMYGKRYFQDHNSSNSTQTPSTPLKYEYREPASTYNMPNQSEGAVGPKIPEMKYSCSMEFGVQNHLTRNPANHIQHNHTYHLPAESSGAMQRPVIRDKIKQRKSEDEHLTRDEKRARALNVPITVDDIINLPMDEFNERLSKYDLSEAQLSLIRDIRRRGKNKVAAQNCRKRKLDQILSLADEVKEMRDRKMRLIADHEYGKAECKRYRDKYQQLYRHVFQNLRDPEGNQYSPYQFSLQTSADGSIIMVPRSNSTVSNSDTKDPLQNHKEP